MPSEQFSALLIDHLPLGMNYLSWWGYRQLTNNVWLRALSCNSRELSHLERCSRKCLKIP